MSRIPTKVVLALHFIYSFLTNVNSIYSQEAKMFNQPKYVTNEQIKNAMPTNVRVTPVVIVPPKVNPMRDDKVTLL